MKHILGGLMIVAATYLPHAQAKHWFFEACENIITGQPKVPLQRLQEIESLLNEQIRFNNRFTGYPVAAAIEPLRFLERTPQGVVLRPQLSADKHWRIQPELAMFVNPNMLDLDWNDYKRGLGETPALLLVVENVEVNIDGRTSRLTEFMEQEAESVHNRYPQMDFRLKSAPAGEFTSLPFKSDRRGRVVVWVEGHVENFQAKRILLIALEAAFENLARDSKFVITKVDKNTGDQR